MIGENGGACGDTDDGLVGVPMPSVSHISIMLILDVVSILDRLVNEG